MSKKRMVTIIAGNGFPLRAVHQLPNQKCYCGSGLKAKRCHGTEAKIFYSKLTERQKADIEAKKKLAEAQKETNSEIKIPT